MLEVAILECFAFKFEGMFCGDKRGALWWKLEVVILEYFGLELKGKFGGDK